jgi:DNA excision repair protein ERCC-2
MGKKTTMLEHSRMTKEEKAELLKQFKSYEKTGAVLLGTSTGSFGEGIDLPGDLLKCVVVVGLPLDQPDLETKELIKYYDMKFGRGWDYGYIFPAFNRCLQNAGRCIRSETDKGVVVFLDQRFIWPMYKRCFPPDSDITVTKHYKEMIEEFFEPTQRRLG